MRAEPASVPLYDHQKIERQGRWELKKGNPHKRMPVRPHYTQYASVSHKTLKPVLEGPGRGMARNEGKGVPSFLVLGFSCLAMLRNTERNVAGGARLSGCVRLSFRYCPLAMPGVMRVVAPWLVDTPYGGDRRDGINRFD